jgi:hypothetical protein
MAVVVALAVQGCSASAADLAGRRHMIEMLHASGPHEKLGSQAAVFDRFIGTWDCEFSIHRDDGTVERFSGELLFGWVMDGWAIQDLWIGFPEAGKPRSMVTTLRAFDPRANIWRVVSVAPSRGEMILLEGAAIGDRILLNGKDSDGSLLRWSFNDIRADFFTWRGEISRDGGKTWQLQEEHKMRRRRAKGTVGN